jgi:hypothetical protein
MLGEQLGEEKGKITMRRVMRTEAGGPKMEVTFQTMGKFGGIECRGVGTYSSQMKPGGHLYGEGQGVVMTKDGESLAWVGQGIGRIKQDGGVSFRGAVYYETASQKLARFNGITVVYEHENDAEDNCSTKFWEWK